MTENTKFKWADHIWSPDDENLRISTSNWVKPHGWNANAGNFMAEHGRRQRVLCAVDIRWRADLFALIAKTPDLDWFILAKHIGDVPAMVPVSTGVLPNNVFLGATIVNQAEADRDIPKLLAVPARVRFLSMEPLLGPVSFEGMFANRNPADGTNALEALDWVIVGGESGPGARPMHPDWARSLRDQCAAAGVPFLFKQWGEWMPAIHEGDTVKLVFEKGTPHGPDQPEYHEWPDGQGAARVGKKAAGRILDGRTWDGFPAP